MAHCTNENYRPRKYSFGGGLAVGSLVGAYLGYKIGRARGTRKGGTFDTEKKIGRGIKSAFSKKKYAGGGSTYSNGGGVDGDKGYLVKAYMRNLVPTIPLAHRHELGYDENVDTTPYNEYIKVNANSEDEAIKKADSKWKSLYYGTKRGNELINLSIEAIYDKPHPSWKPSFEKGGSTYSNGGEVKEKADEFQEQLEAYQGVVDVDYSEGRNSWKDSVEMEYRVFSNDIELLEKIKREKFDNDGNIEKYHGIDYVLNATKWFDGGSTYANGGGVDEININNNKIYNGAILFDGTNDNYEIEKEKIIHLLNQYSAKVVYPNAIKKTDSILYYKLDYSKNYKQLLKELSKIENKYKSVIDVVVFTEKYDGGRSIKKKDYFARGGGVDAGIGNMIVYRTFRDGEKEGEITREIDANNWEVSSGWGYAMVNKNDVVEVIDMPRKKRGWFFEQGGNIDDIIRG